MEGIVLLADYAQVHMGKLNVVGAGINLVGTAAASPPHVIDLYAAALITVPWQAHNQSHNLRVSLLDEDENIISIAEAEPGTPVAEEDEGSVVGQFNAGRAPIMTPGDDSLIPLAVPLRVGVPRLGAYRVALWIDRTEIAAARFRVVYSSSILGQGGP